MPSDALQSWPACPQPSDAQAWSYTLALARDICRFSTRRIGSQEPRIESTIVVDVVVTGYPKSGNTWATRLVAELIGCPVVGFWNSRKSEIAREGLERNSAYLCHKAHQTVAELRSETAAAARIIYIVRDPRDVVVSGSHFFHLYRLRLLEKLFTKTSRYWTNSRRVMEPLLTSQAYRITRMVDVLLGGGPYAGRFLARPWAEHARPCIDAGQFFVRYEDLLTDPDNECRRILDYLGLQRTATQIHEAIERQSFQTKRAAFIAAGDIRQTTFLRSGLAEQWRTELPRTFIERIEMAVGGELRWFGYPMSDAPRPV